MRILLFVPFFILSAGCAHAQTLNIPKTCEYDPKIQRERSLELVKLEEEDQADRILPYDQVDWNKVNPRDLERRIRVAAIFAEGCFKSAADYGNAAMVYQHGTAADHYYQTFLWASRAVQLGDDSRRWLTAAGLDRYLVKIGQKQLFGTQFSKDSTGRWCIQPVESSFPEKRRKEWVKLNLRDATANFIKALNLNLAVDDIRDCDLKLKPSPPGTVPGFY